MTTIKIIPPVAQQNSTPIKQEKKPTIPEPEIIDSEKDKTPKATSESDEIRPVQIPKDQFQKMLQAAEKLDQLQVVCNIKPVYKNFENPGTVCRGIFWGFVKTLNKDKKELNSIVWVEKGGQTFVNSCVILVGDCEKFGLERGMGIQITYKGKKKPSNAYDFEVAILQ